MEKKPIKITLPDGAVKDGKAYETTPLDIAKDISQGLANAVVAAKVDGKVWDLTRRLEGDCNLALLKFDDKDGLDTYWHSSGEFHVENPKYIYCDLDSFLFQLTFWANVWSDISVVPFVMVPQSKTVSIMICGWENEQFQKKKIFQSLKNFMPK